jgi:glycosyltransferase involved in cell wall biosynthesis
MRVLLVIVNNSFGGGERVFAQLAEGLLARGFLPMAAALPGGRFPAALHRLGVPFFPVPLGGSMSVKAVRQLTNIIRSQKPDIVHSQGARADFHARVAARLAGVGRPVCTVAVPVERFDVDPLRKAVYRLGHRATSGWVDQFVTVSESLRSWLIAHYRLHPCRIRTIYNGVELRRFEPERYDRAQARRTLEIPPGAPVVGAVGRLSPEKGHERLIRAAPRVLQSRPEACFVIAGDGPLRRPLEALARRLGIQTRVRFLGFCEDVAAVLSALDVFVLPSLHEGQPMVLLEAMAMAKPAVVGDIHGIREVVRDGETGCVVPGDNLEAMAQAIVALLDPSDKAAEMGRKGRAVVEQRFDIADTIEQHVKLYKELAALV